MDDDPQLTRSLKGLHDFGSKTHIFVMCLGLVAGGVSGSEWYLTNGQMATYARARA